MFQLLFEAAPRVDPSSFRETELFRKCREMGIIPASAADLASRSTGEAASPAVPAHDGGTEGGEMLSLQLTVRGMWCPACAWVIEETLRRTPGVGAPACNFSTDRVRCDYDPVRVSPRALTDRISSLGYTAFLPGDGSAGRERRKEFIRFGISAFLTMNVMMLSFALYSGFFTELSEESVRALSWPTFAMATLVVFAGGWPIHRKAWQALAAVAPGMESLVSVGSLSAYLYSTHNLLLGSLHLYFDTASMLITLLLLGRLLERRAKDEVQEDLGNFFSLRPTKVRVCSESHPEGRYLSAEALRRGDLFRAEAGEILAADGVVVSGTGLLDESSLTGEPVPVAKRPGDRVRSGTRVQQGELTVRAEAVGEDSILGHMITVTEKALSEKTPLEEKTDRILRWFVPAVLGLAAATAAVCWRAGLGADEALTRAVTVMVISCPCTLGIAVPLARVAAISLAGKGGILVRDFAAFELAGRVDTVVLDKTGTVTEGTWTLVGISNEGGLSRNEALTLAASLEGHGDHPIARVLTGRATAEGLRAVEVQDVKIFENGISGVFRGDVVKLGSAEFVAKEPAASGGAVLGAHGSLFSSVFLSVGGRLGAVFLFGDRIRPGARATVEWLRSLGLRVALVSGDGEAATKEIACQAGITEAHGSRLPADKAGYVAGLQREGRIVAMVGDGINDAPALVQADLAVALYSGGPLGKEAPHLTLMRGEPSQLRDFFTLAGRARRKIRQNLACSAGYNAVSIPVAMAGLLTPVVAVGAMILSSLTVIGNTLLLTKRARELL
ncbi:MAG TPA: cation-translocating P-type ATPase [Syntrophobacteria bacterium]|nr:cation-translocating P-type ATPase [Syntrophobacteria bacterium]